MLFTVFTPIYNGAKTIHRVYESLKNQTCQDFEWIIINDGSTDNSEEVILTIISKEPAWRIKYFHQSNLGKHTAWNRAVKEAAGELFLSADCDDSFDEDALDFFRKKWQAIEDKNHVSGINVCCRDNISKRLVAEWYPQDGMISNNVDLDYIYKITGEHWGILSTKVLKKYPFPLIKGHHYSENYIWYGMALDGYKCYCYNKILRTYYIEPKSLTHDKTQNTDIDRLKMVYHFNLWKVRNLSFYFLNIKPLLLIKLYNEFLRSCIKLMIKKYI